MKQKAQGTIEYLVVLAIIVVIGLVIVGLLSGFTDVSKLQGTVTGVGTQTGLGGISITEAVADEDNGVIVLANTDSTPIVITSISAGGETNAYKKAIFSGEKQSFILDSVGSSCLCIEGEKSKTCNYIINYTTEAGIPKSANTTITINCVSIANAINGVTTYTDTIAPTIELTSPEENYNTTNKTISFSFSVDDANPIVSCTLRAGQDTNTYAGISNGNNTITHTFANDIYTDWNISCVDGGGNIKFSTGRTINIDSSDYEITTCQELQGMENDLTGSYYLMNDIDCTETSTWNAGAGFDPIGKCGPNNECVDYNRTYSFKGTLDGTNHKIINLYIHRPNEDYAALFGSIANNVTISNITIEGGEISGGIAAGVVAIANMKGSEDYDGDATYVYLTNVHNSADIYSTGQGGGARIWPQSEYASAGLIGVTNSTRTTISNSSNTGKINAQNGIEFLFTGGLVGYESFEQLNIESSFNSGDINGSGYYQAGLVGDVYAAELTINNSNNSGNLIGNCNSTGGLVGNLGSQPIVINIFNSYNSGNILNGVNSVGGLIASTVGSVSITDSYNTGNIDFGQDGTGGLIGTVWSNTNLIISNTYNTGSILGAGWFGGGLIGQVWSYYIEQAQVSIDNSNSTGLIDGLDSPDSANGGLIGGVEYSSNLTVTNSTWSVPLTGQTNCYTFVNAPGCESGCSIDSNEGCTAQ